MSEQDVADHVRAIRMVGAEVLEAALRAANARVVELEHMMRGQTFVSETAPHWFAVYHVRTGKLLAVTERESDLDGETRALGGGKVVRVRILKVSDDA